MDKGAVVPRGRSHPMVCPGVSGPSPRNEQTEEQTLIDQAFHTALKEMAELHDKKNLDYGSDKDPFANVRASEEFGIPAWLGAIVRANDKMSRLKTFANKRQLANESVEDSLLDLANYAVIALVLYRQAEAVHGREAPEVNG